VLVPPETKQLGSKPSKNMKI